VAEANALLFADEPNDEPDGEVDDDLNATLTARTPLEPPETDDATIEDESPPEPVAPPVPVETQAEAVTAEEVDDVPEGEEEALLRALLDAHAATMSALRGELARDRGRRADREKTLSDAQAAILAEKKAAQEQAKQNEHAIRRREVLKGKLRTLEETLARKALRKPRALPGAGSPAKGAANASQPLPAGAPPLLAAEELTREALAALKATLADLQREGAALQARVADREESASAIQLLSDESSARDKAVATQTRTRDMLRALLSSKQAALEPSEAQADAARTLDRFKTEAADLKRRTLVANAARTHARRELKAVGERAEGVKLLMQAAAAEPERLAAKAPKASRASLAPLARAGGAPAAPKPLKSAALATAAAPKPAAAGRAPGKATGVSGALAAPTGAPALPAVKPPPLLLALGTTKGLRAPLDALEQATLDRYADALAALFGQLLVSARSARAELGELADALQAAKLEVGAESAAYEVAIKAKLQRDRARVLAPSKLLVQQGAWSASTGALSRPEGAAADLPSAEPLEPAPAAKAPAAKRVDSKKGGLLKGKPKRKGGKAAGADEGTGGENTPTLDPDADGATADESAPASRAPSTSTSLRADEDRAHSSARDDGEEAAAGDDPAGGVEAGGGAAAAAATSAAGEAAGVPEGAAGVPEDAAGVPEGAAGVPEGAAGVPEDAAGASVAGPTPESEAAAAAQGEAAAAPAAAELQGAA
jgi:hypothetical protein